MKKYLTIGVAGHVDHGKTALVKHLTGIDTDRNPEEKRRGLSIESGIAAWHPSPEAGIALIDVPGHVDFLKKRHSRPERRGSGHIGRGRR